MKVRLTLTKLEALGHSNTDAIYMITALTRICPYDMIQERKWFDYKGKMTLAIRTTRAVDKALAMPYIEAMITKAKTNKLVKAKIWKDLKSAFETITEQEKQNESNTNTHTK